MNVEREKPQRNPNMVLANNVSLLGCFTVAEICIDSYEEIPNEYCGRISEDHCGICVNRPWLLVKTPLGHIKVGWRKRVIEMDYSQTHVKDLAIKVFDDAFCGAGARTYQNGKEGDSPTRQDRLVHSWGYDDLVKNLRRLDDWASNPKLRMV